jgi:PilZ domain
MQTATHRAEERTPLRVTVDLASLDVHATAQRGITENVSAHGARVVTSHAWRRNERLNVRSLLGDLKSRARVVYCEPLGVESYAVGLELSAKVGEWGSPHERAGTNAQAGG